MTSANNPLARLVQFFRPPALDDPQTLARMQTLLRAFIYLNIVGDVSYTLTALGSPERAVVLIATGSGILLSIVCLLLLERGWFLFSASLLLVVSWGVLVFASLRFGGTAGPLGNVYFLLVMLGGVLLGVRVAGLLVVLISATTLSLVLLSESGIIPPAISQGAPLVQWGLQNVTFIMIIGVLILAQSILNTALRRSQQSENRLEETLRALQASSVSRTYLDNIIRSLPQMLFILAPRGQIIQSVNRAVTHTLGYSEEELAGKPLSLLWMQPVALDESPNQPGSSGTLLRDMEAVFVKKDGSNLPVLVSLSVLCDERQVYGYACVVQDISERKRFESEQQVSQIRYRSLFEQTNDAISIMTLDGVQLAANSQAAALLGYTQNEMVGLTFRDLIVEAEEDQSAVIRQRLAAGERMPPYERTLRHRDGTPIPVEINISLVRDHAGEPLYVQSIVRDIRERKRNEERLRYLAQVLENVSDAIISTDTDNLVRSWNRAAERIFGWSEQEALGKPLHHLARAGSDVANTPPNMNFWQHEITRFNREGKLLRLLESLALLEDPQGHVIGRVVVAHDITARVQAERALLESERRNSALLEAIPDLIFVYRYDGVCVDFNAPSGRELKLPREQVIGSHMRDIGLDAETESAVLAYIHQVLETGEPHMFEYALDMPEGKQWYESRMVRRDADHMLNIVRNITARVHAEQALLASEQRNRALLEAIPDLMFVHDRAGVCIDFYTPLGAPTKLSPDKMIGARVEDIGLEPEYETLLRERIARAVDTGEAQVFEYSMLMNDARQWFEARVVRLNEGQALNIVRNITSRVLAEQEIRAQQVMYRTLASNLPKTAVMIFNADLRYLLAEGPLLAETGFDRASMEGRTIHEVLEVDSIQELEPYYRRALAGETLTFDRSVSDREFKAYIHPLKTEKGAIYAGMLVVQDLTELRQQEKALRRYTQELQRSNRELQDFAYVASHDLQEPLRKIQAFSDRLVDKHVDQLDATGRDYLGRLHSAAGRMHELINGLLAFSRVTTQGQPFAPVDLNAVVQTVLEDLDWRLEQTHGTVAVDALPVIEADASQMRQLMLNLVANALKYHRPDVVPQISIRCSPVKDAATAHATVNTAPTAYRIEVQDNGIGFDSKYAERIFGVFQRLHGRSEYEGTGIGLAICRKIVERHNGQITAAGVAGQGATFTIILPARQHHNP